jgi:hypothetical protein
MEEKNFQLWTAIVAGFSGHDRVFRLCDSVHPVSITYRCLAAPGFRISCRRRNRGILLIISVTLAVGGFCFGFRYHKRCYIFIFLIAGLALIFTGRISVDGNLELPFVVLLLASGPVLNRRLCQRCRRCHAHERRTKSELD